MSITIPFEGRKPAVDIVYDTISNAEIHIVYANADSMYLHNIMIILLTIITLHMMDSPKLHPEVNKELFLRQITVKYSKLQIVINYENKLE